MALIRITTARLGDALPQEFLALNVTRKSGMQTLAPPWTIVRGVKTGRISRAAYEAIYRQLMLRSQQEQPDVWAGMIEEGAKGKILCLQCYCRRGAFCHRHILAKMVQEFAEAQGHEARIIGE
jgi:hypothetical protein